MTTERKLSEALQAWRSGRPCIKMMDEFIKKAVALEQELAELTEAGEHLLQVLEDKLHE